MNKKDWIPFNGIGSHPWGSFICYILAIVGWIVILLLFSIISFSPASTESTAQVTVKFSNYSVDENTLMLHAENGSIYSIHYYKHFDGLFDDPLFLCDGALYTIHVDEQGSIKAIQDIQEAYLITFEAERAAYRSYNKLGYIGIVCFLLLTVIVFIISLVVSNHSERYPKWLCRILFYDNPFIP